MRALRMKINSIIKKCKGKVSIHREQITRAIALVMCLVFCINALVKAVSSAALADTMGDYKGQLGTQLGLNSPLLRDEVTSEKFEPWELEVFAIFLSNFCTPLVDSMDSAFGVTKEYGSKGAGQEALKFNTGGDLVAGGILQNMVTFALSECYGRKIPLYIDYNIIRNGQTVLDKSQFVAGEACKKEATLGDLLPIFAGFYNAQAFQSAVDSWVLGSDAPLPSKSNSNSNITYQDVLEHGWALFGYSTAGTAYNESEKNLQKIKPNLVSLPTLKVKTKEGNPVTAFDLADGWDSQIWALCINYGISKGLELGCADDLEGLLSATDSKLYLDGCGNIVADWNNRNIVLIPACVNRNLRVDRGVNYIVAPILNDLCAASALNIAGGISNQASVIDQSLSKKDHAATGDIKVVKTVIGSGLGLDTSASADRDSDNNIIKLNDAGLIQYGNILLYNTSDTSIGWGYGDTVSANKIKEILKQSRIDLNHNVCVSTIGSVLRVPGCNMDALFGLYDQTTDQIRLASTWIYKDSSSDLTKTIVNKLGDRWGTLEGNLGTQDQFTAVQWAAIAAQVLISWGVNIGNSITEYNNKYALDLYTEKEREECVINENKSAYVSATLAADQAIQSSILSMMRSSPGVSIAAFGAAGALTGIAVGCMFVPVAGWIVGGAILVGGLIATLFACDEEDIPYMNKVAFCANVQYMNDMANGLNNSVTPIDDAADTYKTQLKQYIEYGALTEIGKRLGSSHSKPFAAAIANGCLGGYLPRSSEYVGRIYELIDSGADEEDIAALLSGGRFNEPYDKDDDSKLANMAESVAVVALAAPGLVTARDYLCMKNSATFATYASWFYIDYLKWYGFDNDKGPDAVFNKQLFDAVSSRLVDPEEDIYNDIFQDAALTEDQKKQKVQDYTYMALTPTADGVEYRNQILVSGVEKWMATEYNNICYGSLSSQGIGTDGMLKMVPYSENFMTRWLIANWNRILVITIYLSIIALFLIGALKGKKFSWFVVTLLSTILMLVILPTTGEITPYVCDKVVQSMFQKGAQYWAVNEGIEDEYLMSSYSETTEDASALKYIKAASITNTSKSLMLKHDISKKVICTAQTDTAAMLRLASTRWILGNIMRQISADNSGEIYDYVYTTLSDERDALKDLFIMYYSRNNSTNTLYNRPYAEEDETIIKYVDYCNASGYNLLYESWKKPQYEKYKSPTLYDSLYPNSDHIRVAYIYRLAIPSNGTAGITVASIEDANGHITIESMDAFQKKIVTDPSFCGTSTEWIAAAKDIVMTRLADWTEIGAKQEFGFLHMTEDIIPYFYLLVKDTYCYDGWADSNGDPSLITAQKSNQLGYGNLMTNLLGRTYPVAGGTKKVRVGVPFCIVGDESYTRDILDLEYLFTNVVPYMSAVMFAAGGEDGSNGRLQDVTMEDIGYNLYGDSEASWLFRSNWIIKLISSNNYSKKTTVTDASGKSYVVEHQLFPQNYPDDRPMVFSEAQMVSMGLQESDLSLVELCCVNTNKKVVEDWQMLINYANTDGISRDIIEEQMAIEAAMIFNKEFVDDNGITSELALYPTSFDLRCINFDAVLKLLVISDNYNNASLKQDAIYTIMADKGFWGGALALAAAWLCQVGIPLLRNVTLGILFYCALICCLYNMLNDSKKKAYATLGGTTSNIIYAAMTIAYYCIFWMLITRAGGDLILTKDGFNTGTSNIIWKVIIIIVASVVYMFFSVKFILKVVLYDVPSMGMSILKQYASTAYVKVKGFFDGIAAKFGSKKAAENSRESAAKDVADVRDRVESSSGTVKEEVKVTDGDVNIKNTTSNPVPVFTTNNPGDSTYVEPGDDDGDSGYVEDDTDESLDDSE